MDQKSTAAAEDEVSLKDIVATIRLYIRYIFSKWRIILIGVTIGGTLGYLYTYKQIPVYTAVCTFILDGGGSTNPGASVQGLPQLLGAQAVGQSSAGGGLLSLFQTTNYTALYKSRRILEQAMLSEAVFNSEKKLLIDYYIDLKKYRNGPMKSQFENVDFHVRKEKFTSRHNMIMNMVLKDVKDIFTIQNAEAGAPVLSIKVQTPDSLLSKVFSERILEVVNKFYIETKNYKAQENIARLEKNSDSLKTALFSAMSGVASAQEQIPNVNTAYQTVKLPPQKKQIEVSFLQTLYTTTASELETARNEMRGIPPFIIVLDKPTFPLPVSQANITYGVIIGIMASLILTILVLILVLLVKKLLS
jgi:hypothetical protein